MTYTTCLIVSVSSVTGAATILKVKAGTSIEPKHLPCQPTCLALPACLISPHAWSCLQALSADLPCFRRISALVEVICFMSN